MSHVSFIYFGGHNIKNFKVVELRQKRAYDLVWPANIDYVFGEDGKT